MSFQNFNKGRDKELADVSSQRFRDVESNIFKLANSVSQFKRLIDVLGTTRDTTDHRTRMATVKDSCQALAKRIKEQVTALTPSSGTPGAGGLTQEPEQLKARKLMQDFSTILQDYKAAQKLAVEREGMYLPKPSPVSAAGASTLLGVVVVPGADGSGADGTSGTSRDAELERQALLQQQQQVKAALLENAIQYHDALIEERDHDIAEIHRQIGEVNEMFQDLAVLINDQGVQLNTVDEHITSTAERTLEASRELTQAERHQKSTRNTCLWLWLAAALVVSIVLILLFA